MVAYGELRSVQSQRSSTELLDRGWKISSCLGSYLQPDSDNRHQKYWWVRTTIIHVAPESYRSDVYWFGPNPRSLRDCRGRIPSMVDVVLSRRPPSP